MIRKKPYRLTSNIGKYRSTLVSQIYRYKYIEIYPREYLLYYSLIDIVSTVLGKEEQSDYIDYF